MRPIPQRNKIIPRKKRPKKPLDLDLLSSVLAQIRSENPGAKVIVNPDGPVILRVVPGRVA